MNRKALLVLTAITALVGCDSPSDNGVPPAVLDITVDSSGPIYRYLDVRLADAGKVEVKYHASDKPTLQLLADSSARRHRIFLPRLAPERTYTFEVRSLTGGNARSEARVGTVSTGSLPADLKALSLAAQGTATQPLTMFELMITTTGFTGAFVADDDGDVVWYWRTQGWINGVSRRQNGNFVMLDADSGLVELTPDASVVNRLRNGSNKPYGLIHHDATVSPQNTIYFLARDIKLIRDTAVTGEAIWEWVPETGVVTKKWSAFDYFDWAKDRGGQSAAFNWMHANSIMIGPRNNIVISARNTDEVFSIAPDFKSIEWRLNGPNPTLQMPVADKFYSQHSAIEVAPNRILLMDNGLGRPSGEWTRVAEYAIDPVAKTAAIVWQYRPSPDILATRVGSVTRTTNGNTVAAFGWGQGYPITVREVNAAGSVMWSLTGKQPEFGRVYRMKPLASIGGEMVVQ
jgi:hypothetical protein